MSEYQYYEFAAIDRPLSRTEMAELRAVSTRAAITPSGFVNSYEWGDLKADPADWIRRYFDAFVYTANWCSCRLALRLPLATFGKAELKPFAAKYALTIKATCGHWILDWTLDESEDYDRFSEDDGRGWMQRLAPLRDELLRGDLRALYLGWLAGASRGDLRDNTLEPEVPPRLEELSPSGQALVEFLEIPPDWVAAASAAAAPFVRTRNQGDDHIDAWLGGLSRDEMAAALKWIVQGRGAEAEHRLRSHYAAWRNAQTPATTSPARRRTVAALRKLVESRARARRE